jgi:hypothetical protein
LAIVSDFVFAAGHSLNLLETLRLKALRRCLTMAAELLNGNKIGEDETDEAVIKNAETAFALMGTACGA